jgi:NO-binding membrane sensor protein with MHYT domain/methyl-accepting chemotaxis protein
MFRVFNCLVTEHDLRLVVIAGLVCFLASFTAINLFGRARVLSGRARMYWVIAAGAAAGCGIWATHFIAMLSYDPGISIAYNLGLTALSLVMAMTITSLGLIAAIQARRVWAGAVGGSIVGGGVACMHYLGMWAVEVPGRVSWSIDLVAVSIALGMLLGAVALTIALKRNDIRSSLVAALFLTLAIVSHHFTAMGAVEIVPDPTRMITSLSLSPASLALAVASAAISILSMSLVSAFADRRVGDKSLLLTTVLNNMTQGVVMFDAHERFIICNDRYMEMYNLSRDVVKPGCMLLDIIQHRATTGSLRRTPEEYRAELVTAVSQGRTVSSIVETPSGRSVSVVNKPIPGGKYWVGTHDDITERLVTERKNAAVAEQDQRRATVESAIQSFRESVKIALKTVSESAAAMKSTASELSSSSNETARHSAEAITDSHAASESVAIAASATEEMSKSILEIDQQLSQAANLVGDAVIEADTTNKEIGVLADAAQKIGDVIKLIQGIAQQTNLLALNATIEAARAGQAGRGFSVVASEVKALSVQTAKATEEIAGQIQAVQNSSRSAVDAIQRITKRMKNINEHTASIAASVGQQSAVTNEISQHVTSAAQGAKVVTAVLDQVADAVTKTGNSAGTVFAASQSVQDAARALEARIEDFLKKVAA